MQPNVQRHLIVAAAGGVQAFARVPHPAGKLLLHKGVDILRVGINGQLARFQLGKHPLQSARDRVPVGLRQNTAAAQHIGMGKAARNVLPEHALIKGNGGIEIIGFRIRRVVITPSPKFHNA